MYRGEQIGLETRLIVQRKDIRKRTMGCGTGIASQQAGTGRIHELDRACAVRQDHWSGGALQRVGQPGVAVARRRPFAGTLEARAQRCEVVAGFVDDDEVDRAETSRLDPPASTLVVAEHHDGRTRVHARCRLEEVERIHVAQPVFDEDEIRSAGTRECSERGASRGHHLGAMSFGVECGLDGAPTLRIVLDDQYVHCGLRPAVGPFGYPGDLTWGRAIPSGSPQGINP